MAGRWFRRGDGGGTRSLVLEGRDVVVDLCYLGMMFQQERRNMGALINYLLTL